MYPTSQEDCFQILGYFAKQTKLTVQKWCYHYQIVTIKWEWNKWTVSLNRQVTVWPLYHNRMNHSGNHSADVPLELLLLIVVLEVKRPLSSKMTSESFYNALKSENYTLKWLIAQKFVWESCHLQVSCWFSKKKLFDDAFPCLLSSSTFYWAPWRIFKQRKF